jgi:predicted DNA-binding WGR domain protein
MPDEQRSPIKHHLVLHRIDPEQGGRHFYSLMIERELFGSVRLVRNWGRIRTKGREIVEEFETDTAAGRALEEAAKVLRARGYQDL